MFKNESLIYTFVIDCKTCFNLKVFCSRFVNEHMLMHSLEAGHLMCLSYSDLSVWCYGCDQYVDNEVKFMLVMNTSIYTRSIKLYENVVRLRTWWFNKHKEKICLVWIALKTIYNSSLRFPQPVLNFHSYCPLLSVNMLIYCLLTCSCSKHI